METIMISTFIVLSSCNQAADPYALINQKTSLLQIFNLSGLHQKINTSWINNKDSTISILYWNNPRSQTLQQNAPFDLSGTLFTIETLHQQANPH